MKNTTKRAPKKDSARELAEHISAVLDNPNCPVSVYNALADAVSELNVPRSLVDGPEYIAVLLRHYYKTESVKGDE